MYLLPYFSHGLNCRREKILEGTKVNLSVHEYLYVAQFVKVTLSFNAWRRIVEAVDC